MSIVELSLSQDIPLYVRRFAVREAVSSPFSISLWAHSPDPSLDLDAIVGTIASFRTVAGYAFLRRPSARAWSGIINHAEQVHAVHTAPGQEALSTYYLRLVPTLWLLTQRRGNRIYQHLSIPDIIDRLLAEWSIQPAWQIDRARYPKLEYKVQYGETDHTFFSRLLEEAGIAFTFAADEASTLTFSDHLEANEPRPTPPIPYADNPNQVAEQEFVTNTRLTREVRPGAEVIRGYDFRNPAFALFAEAPRASGVEARLEQYHYHPGGFLVETGKPAGHPVADDQGFARHDPKYGADLTTRALHGDRIPARGVTFDANTFDLAPGVVFSIDNHPHAEELSASRKLLLIETSIDGTPEGEWNLTGHAVFADAPYRPSRRSPRPIIHGLHNATVVGPAGQEIHTDEFGRIRVQFPWDREGQKDEHSSCWIRVNQGTGGAGWGLLDLPRLGQEVLVSFLQGDPDHPVLAGRAYNAIEQLPYRLPEHKTRSTWKSNTSPGGGGFNEILFEDLKGKELVWQQAQKNRERKVKHDEQSTVAHDRQKLVKNSESEHTDGARQRLVAKDADKITRRHKRECIEAACHLAVRGSRSELVQGTQSLTVVQHQQESVTGRQAFRAGKQIHLVAGENFVGEGVDDVTIRGPGGFIRIDSSGIVIKGTLVKINVSGSPGKGRGSHPALPEEPVGVDTDDTWLEIVLVDEDDPSQPVPFQRYRVELPDGTVHEGQLDADGKARLEGVAAGDCKVTFPDLDEAEWR